jgi:hypothetical protein
LYGWYTGGFPALRTYAALFAIVLIAYANAFGLGFALDGRHLATVDTRTQAATLDNVKLIFNTDYWWPTSVDPLYRPVTTLSFLLNYSVLGSGPRPFGYHALNILLHAANVLLVFVLFRRIFRREGPAFFAAAIWAVHPIGVESVANVAGRADLLAAAGMLGGLVVYSSGRRFPAIFALAALAAFAKETGAMLIALMLLWDLTPGLSDLPWRRKLPAYAAALAGLAIYALMRFRVMDAMPWPVQAFPDNPLRAASFLEARWTAIKILGMDLALLLWPAKLVSDRAYAQIVAAPFSDPAAWASAISAGAILAAVILRRRSEPLLFWAAGFFALTLLPASNLAVLINATMAERFLYLPAVGFAAALAALVYRFAPRHAAVALGIAAALFAARTLVRNRDWDNEIALMGHDTKVSPLSFRVHDAYGEFLYAADRNNLDLAIAEIEKSWAILSPLPPEKNTPQIPGALATYYLIKGDRFPTGSPEALSWYRKALPVLQRGDEILRVSEKIYDRAQVEHGKPLPPRRPSQQLYILLGNAQAALRNFPEAFAAYRYARGMAPLWPEPYDRAAAAHRAAGDAAAAARVELEKTFALGMTPSLLAGLERAYRDLPGGSCAIRQTNGIPMLNADCPVLREDICRALSGVAQMFTDARQPERARGFTELALKHGCAAR